MIFSIAQVLSHDAEPRIPSRYPSSFGQRFLARRDLRINLRGETLTFDSIEDFSFALESRTSIPSARLRELLKRSRDELEGEAIKIKAIEKNLVEILEDALCDGGECGPSIQNLGLRIFSQDHNWRALMDALVEQGPRFDAYKRLALIKYMQYLGARQETLRVVFELKFSSAERPSTSPGELSNALQPVAANSFDGTANEDSHYTPESFERLPQGETIKVRVLPGHPVSVLLAKHTVTILNDDGWMLFDPKGQRHQLSERQNLVGRNDNNDVALGSEYRNVSRRHLIAQPVNRNTILLTDISSHGTFVPSLHIDRAAAA